MDYFIFLSQKILAGGVNALLMGILPALTVLLFFGFDFEYLVEDAWNRFQHNRAMKKLEAQGEKRVWKYSSRVRVKDYFPFKLPIGIFVILMVAILSVGAIAGYRTTPMFNDLNRNFLQSYEEYQQRDAEQNPVRTNVRVDLHRIRLDGWNPPKHFYVNFKDLDSGIDYEHVYVSKHCNSAGQLKQGDEFNVQIQVYTVSNQPDKEFREFVNLYGVFCS